MGKCGPCDHNGDCVIVVEMPITLMLRLKSGCGPYFKTHCATRIKLGLDVFGSIVWVLSINWWKKSEALRVGRLNLDSVVNGG